MFSKFQLAKKYLQYWFSASNKKGHGVHSPFVFEFITKVINDKKDYPSYDSIEFVREKMLQDTHMLTIEDFGAGSRVNSNYQRSVQSIAKSALKPRKFSQLMHRMVRYYKPETVLELGTSLGITSSYLASARPEANVVTMEGAPEVAAVAKQNFQNLRLQNIEVVEGNFDETLQCTLASLPSVDFAFIDGNHRYKPTVEYFNQILERANNDSIIILDDIHWSEEMEQAWHEVQQHPRVTMTLDLFFIGIVLIKEEFKIPQHFVLKV